MHRKEDLYIKAIALRSKGFSQNEIRKRIPIAQGTISRWCRDVLLTEKQKERLVRKRNNNPFIRNLKKRALWSKKEAKIWATKQANKISNSGELLIITGIILYWAEGTKTGVGGSIEFTNTDPKIIKIMMRFLKEIVDVPKDKFRIIVRLSDKGDIKQAEQYWSRITKVPLENFRKPEMLKLKKNSKSIEKYPHGMCRITIHDVLIRRKMLALIKEFSKKFQKKQLIRNEISPVPVAQWIRAEAS